MLSSVIFILISFYGWAIFGAKRTENAFLGPLWGISTVSVVVYLCSLIGLLYFSALTLMTLGYVFLIYYSFRKTLFTREYYGVSVWFLIVSVMALSNSWGVQAHAWDEFSHWGPQLKQLIIFQELQQDDTLLLMYDYIPGSSLLRYLGYFFKNKSEDIAYFINWLFIYFCFLSVMDRKQPFGVRNILLFVSLFLGLTMFFQLLTMSLLVDPLQAALFLAILVVIFEDAMEIRLLTVLPLLLFMVISKHVGIIFSLSVVFTYAFSQFLLNGKIIREQVIRLIVVVLFIIFIYLTWKIYLYGYNIKAIAVLNISMLLESKDGVFLSLLNNLTGVLINKFPHAPHNETVFSYPTFIHLLWHQALFVIVFIASCLFCLRNKEIKIISVRMLILLVFLFIYLVFLAFIRSVTPWSGDLWSFSRYWSVFLFPVMFYVYVYLFNKADRLITLVPFFLVILFFSFPVTPALHILFAKEERSEKVFIRQKSLHLKESVSQALNGNINEDITALYIYETHGDLMTYFISRNELFPMKFRSLYETTCLTESKPSTPCDIEKIIANVDIVIVDHPNPKFWETYGKFFSDTKHIVYKVKKNDKIPAQALGEDYYSEGNK